MARKRKEFPISRDPPEGGTCEYKVESYPPVPGFPISRDPPEGGTWEPWGEGWILLFPISRDPPEGGTLRVELSTPLAPKRKFPISRDPPEGGTGSWTVDRSG